MLKSEIKLEKTPLLVFYRDGKGRIGTEFGFDLGNVGLEQQLIGAIKITLDEMIEDIRERLVYKDDETERSFT